MPPRVPPALKPFHPIVRAWFRETLGEPSAPQRDGWPAIASGGHTVILAPTGTGKTLTAFLWELNQLIVDGAREPLANAVQILYVSPLKALNNDIQRNLERPLSELRERFTAAGKPVPEIRAAVRTGDTPAAQSHYDAGIAAHHAHDRARPRHVQRRTRRHRRRDPCDRRVEARSASRAD